MRVVLFGEEGDRKFGGELIVWKDETRELRKKSVFANDTIKYSSTVTEGGEEGVIVTRITAGSRISVRSKGDKFPRQISLVQLSFINEDIGIPLRGVPYV